MASILARIRPEQVEESPFPHVVIENAWDRQTCDRLLREFPPDEAFVDGRQPGSNEKFYLSAERSWRKPGIAPAWRRAIRDHLGTGTWRHLVRIFGRHLQREYPNFRSLIGDPLHLRVGTRDIDRFAENEVLLDAKALLHTPVTGATVAERGPHLKNYRTLFLYYLYLRPPEDDVEGGDHAFYAPKPGAERALGPRQALEFESVDAVKIVPYRHNTMVLFMNTPRSFQTNTPRPASPFPMRGLHLSAYVRVPLFDVPLLPGVERVDFTEWAPPPKHRWTRRLFGLRP